MSLKTVGLSISIGAIFTGATALSATKTAITKLETSIKKIEDKKTTLKIDSKEYELATKKVNLLNNTIDKLKVNRAKIEVNNLKNDEFEKTMGKRTATAVIAFTPIYKAINFEDSMADVKKVLNGVSKEEFKGIEQDVLKLGKSFSVPFEELAAVTASGGRLGIAKDNLIDFTKTVSKMKIAFDIKDAQKAGDSAAHLMENFKLSSNALVTLGDAINHLSNTGTKAESIIDVLERTAGTAKAFGLTEIQTAALSHTFLKLGVSSDVAGTGIKAVLTKLSTADKQGKDFQDALSKIGLSGKRLKDSIEKNPQKALENFLAAIEKVPKKDKMGILLDLFGMEYADDVALLSGNLDTYRKALENVSDASKYQGSLDEEYKARMDTIKSKLVLLGNAFSAIAINIGNIFLPTIDGLISVFTKLSDIFDFGIANYPTLTTVFTSIGVGAMSLSVIIPTLGYAFFFAQNGLLKFKSMLQVTTALFKLSTYTTAISTATTKAYAIAKGIATVAVKAFTFAKLLAGKAVSAFRFAVMATNIVTKFLIASLGAGSIASRVFAFTTLFMSKAFNIAKIAVRGLVGATGIGLLIVAATLIYEYWTPITNFFSDLWAGIKIKFNDGVNYISSIFTSPIETITNTWNSLFDWLSSKFDGIGKSIDYVKSVGSNIGDFFSSGKDTVKNTSLATITATSLMATPVPQMELKEQPTNKQSVFKEGSDLNQKTAKENKIEHNTYSIVINVTNPTSNVDIEKAVKKAISDLKRDNFNRELS